MFRLQIYVAFNCFEQFREQLEFFLFNKFKEKSVFLLIFPHTERLKHAKNVKDWH